MSVVWRKFHRWQQPSKNGNHVVKIAVIRNDFLQANEWPERLHTMQCIASNLSLFLVFTLYFVSLVNKVRVCYSLIAESCKMIHEMTNFLSACRFYSANALMRISTWCMSLVGQWLFLFLFLIYQDVRPFKLHVYW